MILASPENILQAILHLLVFASVLGERTGTTITVTRTLIDSSWQSTAYTDSSSYCFSHTADGVGQWNYLHTAEESDHGYQWLVVKLNRPLRVLAVKITARHYVPERAFNIEVRIASDLPDGLLRPQGSSCTGTISHHLVESQVLCGSTDHSILSTVPCSLLPCDKMTNYIILRKRVTGASDRILNFQNMEITEVPIPLLAKFNMMKTWQSSSWRYGTQTSCFWQPSSPAEYFQSGSWSTADAGYHWFLLQLKQPAFIWKVQIQAGRGNEDDRNGAAAIQVYYSGTLPNEVAQRDSCQSDWMSKYNPEEFTQCGTTKESGIANNEHLVVSCCTSTYHMRAAVILLRKPASTHANMSFVSLGIASSASTGFRVCGGGGSDVCSDDGLKFLTASATVTVQAHLLCSRSNNKITLSVKLVNGSSLQPSTEFVSLSASSYSFQLTGQLWMQGAELKTGFQCADGSQQMIAERLEFVEPAQTVNLSLYNAPHWLVGKTAEFSFKTGFALPAPEHSCQLVSSSGETYPLIAVFENRQERFLTNYSSFIRLQSVYRLTVNGSYEGGNVRCQSRLKGTSVVEERILTVPQFFYPSKTRFDLPPPSAWQDGETISLTVDSAESNGLETTHACFLQMANKTNETLHVISSTNSSIVYSVNVSKNWGAEASIACLVNQSGLFEIWRHQRLPTVLYAASITWSLSSFIAEDQPAEINVTATAGQPPPQVACSVNSSSGVTTDVPLNSNLAGYFTPDRDMNSGELSCSMTQYVDSEIIYSETINTSLIVWYKANSTWTATEPLVVMEDQPLSVELTSIGGNPNATHQCGIRLDNGSFVFFHNRAQLEDDPLVTNFSFISLRPFDQGQLVCFAIQAAYTQHVFSQNLTVYYPATVALLVPEIVDEGTEAEFSLTASKCQPQPSADCSIAWGSENTSILMSTNWTGSFNVSRRMHTGVLTCTVTQSNDSNVVFSWQGQKNLTVHFTTNSSWTAGHLVVLKEGDPLSVSVTSVEGNPEPSQRCWLITAQGLQVELEPHSHESNGTQLLSQFEVPLLRRFNTGRLNCNVSQEGRPDYAMSFWQDVTVLFSAGTISWSGQLVNGTELHVWVLTDEGNPRPELECSLLSETVAIERLTAIPESQTEGENHGWSRKIRLFQKFMEPQSKVTVTCLVSQSLNNGSQVFGSARNTKFFRADYSVIPTSPPTTKTTRKSTTMSSTKTKATELKTIISTTKTTIGVTSGGLGTLNDLLSRNASLGEATTTVPIKLPASSCPQCGKAAQSKPDADHGLIGLGLTCMAVIFSIALAAGTYRCISRSSRRVQLVAIPLQVVGQGRQLRRQQSRQPPPLPPPPQLQPQMLEQSRESVPNQYDIE